MGGYGHERLGSADYNHGGIKEGFLEEGVFFRTDLKDREELIRQRGRMFQAEGTAFAGLEVRKPTYLNS